jgi:hypothetical protein
MTNAALSLVKLFGRTTAQGWGKDQYQAAISDQKRYNREILNHYPIVPYGIRRVT